MSRLAIAAMLGVFCWGCLGSGEEGQMTYRDTIAMLQAGDFHGQLAGQVGGSPLSVGSKQVFFLGPENSSLSFNGEVDFTGPTSQPAAD